MGIQFGALLRIRSQKTTRITKHGQNSKFNKLFYETVLKPLRLSDFKNIKQNYQLIFFHLGFI